MRTYRDAKTMAKALREELSRRDLALSHGECLDIVARQFGLGNWNVLAARLGGAALDGTALTGAIPAAAGAPALLLPAGWTFEGSRLDYDVGVDTRTRHGSGHPAMIRSRFAADHPAHARTRSGLAALFQELDAAAYRGKRLRLQADLRTEAVLGAVWAGGFDLREAEAGEAVTKAPERRSPRPINLDFSKLEGAAT